MYLSIYRTIYLSMYHLRPLFVTTYTVGNYCNVSYTARLHAATLLATPLLRLVKCPADSPDSRHELSHHYHHYALQPTYSLQPTAPMSYMYEECGSKTVARPLVRHLTRCGSDTVDVQIFNHRPCVRPGN